MTQLMPLNLSSSVNMGGAPWCIGKVDFFSGTGLEHGAYNLLDNGYSDVTVKCRWLYLLRQWLLEYNMS